MHPPLALCVFWLLPLALTLEEDSPLDCVPRKSVPSHSECCFLSCLMLAHNVSACVGSYSLSNIGFTYEGLNHWCLPKLISHVLCLAANAHLFHEEGVFNYSTMLLREDLDLLLLGAREAVYALDLKDITKKLASVRTLMMPTSFK